MLYKVSYCILGTLVISGIVLYSYFWLLFVCHLALKVFYPLKSAKFIDSNYSKKIYIAEVLILFLIGTVPSIVLAAGSNYRLIGFPPIYCGADSAFQFYVIILPVLISNCANMMLMLFVIYRLHMVSLIVLCS